MPTSPRALLPTVVLLATLVALSGFGRAAIIGTYVDAKAIAHPNGTIDGTTPDPTSYSGPFNTTPSSAFAATFANSYTDNLWDDWGMPQRGLDSAGTLTGSDHNVIDGGATNGPPGNAETNPTITTTVTGLAPASYDVYVVYWSGTAAGDRDWSVRAKLSTAATFVEYDHDGAGSAVAGTFTGIVPTDINVIGVYEAKIGTISGTSFSVDIQNSTITGERTRYEGVAYVALPEPASLAAMMFAAAPFAARRRR